MNTEKLKSLIKNSDMVTVQKNVTIGFIDRAEANENKTKEDRLLIEQFGETRLSEVLYSTDDVKIYSINEGKGERSKRYPIRSIYKNEKNLWRRCPKLAPTFELTFLIYLEYKYLGSNSQFSNFAIKMLGITIEE